MEEHEDGSLRFSIRSGDGLGRPGHRLGPRAASSTRRAGPPSWAKDADALSPLTLESFVEAASGGACIVRVTTSGFGTGADWEAQWWDDMGANSMPFFDNLRLYMSSFPSQQATQMEVSAIHACDADTLWTTLAHALGLRGEGSTVDVTTRIRRRFPNPKHRSMRVTPIVVLTLHRDRASDLRADKILRTFDRQKPASRRRLFSCRPHLAGMVRWP